ncbi:MAG: protein kinase domain-containing protein [Segniliparus sp.]|uniref:protein kinase domain-containing protein n=1 Tax=Segniliparus sp. TaxID=2804064 RepID=UPI003F3A49B2
MTRPSSPSGPLAGTVLEGRYRLDEQIGSGGMCVVYRGFDQRLERPVAVKIAAEQFSGDQRIGERLNREALAIARLSDPGLVGVYDQGSVGGRPYLVLEYVAGGTARELLAERGAMPPYAAAALVGPVLRALGAAHSLGFVHGDVKPENILISTAGEVKLADFGSVAPVAGDERDLADVFGTVGYLAPEQVDAGLWTDVSPAVDVYAAGVVLYELLTGALPFTGDSPAALASARLRHDVPPPSRAVDGVPMQFDHLVLRATERNLRARYPDARSMAADLERIRTELDLPRYSVPAPTTTARPPAPPAIVLLPPSSPRRSDTGPSSPAQRAEQSPSPHHTTINLATLLSDGDHQPDLAGPLEKPVGDPFSRPIAWQRIAMWLVVVLFLGFVAVAAGYGLAALIEHQLS